MNIDQETKSEIRARIEELESILRLDELNIGAIKAAISDRIVKLNEDLEVAQEDLSSSIIESHKAICEVKMMGEKEAYGNDPAVYYTLAICGESGEMANEIVKAQRNGADKEKVLRAIEKELPDVIIYSYVLAYVLDINLNKLVNEKVDVVIQRARDGYYGGPLTRTPVR